MSMQRTSSARAKAPRGEAVPAGARHHAGGCHEDRHADPPGRHGPTKAHEARRSPLPRELLTGLTVLVVDDDVATVEYFAAALIRCGARVLTAFDAHEALLAVEDGQPDVVVADIAMPGGDGYWMLQEMRAREGGGTRPIPVVAATAYGREHSPARTLAAGFTAHLAKPVEPDALCRTVARAAGRA
jgi:CheY-like chemotaxis protein